MEIIKPIELSDVGPLIAAAFENLKRHEKDVLSLRLQVEALKHPGKAPNQNIIEQITDHHDAQTRAYDAIISRCRQQK